METGNNDSKDTKAAVHLPYPPLNYIIKLHRWIWIMYCTCAIAERQKASTSIKKTLSCYFETHWASQISFFPSFISHKKYRRNIIVIINEREHINWLQTVSLGQKCLLCQTPSPKKGCKSPYLLWYEEVVPKTGMCFLVAAPVFWNTLLLRNTFPLAGVL